MPADKEVPADKQEQTSAKQTHSGSGQKTVEATAWLEQAFRGEAEASTATEAKPVEDAEAETKQPETDPAQKPKLSRRQLEAAKFAKLDPETVSQESLAILARERSENSRWASRVGQMEARMREYEAKQAEAAEGRGANPDDEDLSLTDEDLADAEAMKRKWNRMADKMKKPQTDHPRQQPATDSPQETEENDSEFEEDLDDWFESLPTELYPDFGTAPMGHLANKSPAAQARGAIVSGAMERVERAKALGKELTIQDALQAELRAEYPDQWLQQREVATKASEKKAQTKALRTGGTQPPGTRAGVQRVDQRVEAISYLADGLREMDKNDGRR